jgi:hypothetical protein
MKPEQTKTTENTFKFNKTKLILGLSFLLLLTSACGGTFGSCVPSSGDPNCNYPTQAEDNSSQNIHKSTLKPSKNLGSFTLITPEPTTKPENLNLNPHFCARADFPELMQHVKELGAKYVRIWKPYEQIGDPNSDLEKLFNEAEKQRLIPLFVFSPKNPIPDNVIRQKIDYILNHHPKTAIELLNEVDNKEVDSWQGRSFKTAAHFVKVATDEIRLYDQNHPNNPQTTIVLGALSDADNLVINLQSYIRELQTIDLENPNLQIDLSTIDYAVHAYITKNNDSLGDIANIISNKAIPALSSMGITNPEIWVTEYGALYNAGVQPLLIDGTNAAFGSGAKVVCYHAVEPESETDIYPTWFGLRHSTINALGSFIASEPK